MKLRIAGIGMALVTAGVLLVGLNGCGRQLGEGESDSELMDVMAGRVDATKLLDLIAITPENAKMRGADNVSAAEMDAAFDGLHKSFKLDARDTGKLKLDDKFAGRLGQQQKQGFDKLARGYAARLREGEIKIVQKGGMLAVVPANGKYEASGPGMDKPIVREPGGIASQEVEAVDGDLSAASTMHRVGDGRWSWRLSYNWWGVRLSVNHNFLNYLCYNTSWMLSNSGLPGWVKAVIGVLGCVLHRLDTGYNGASISITWAGVFWYTP